MAVETKMLMAAVGELVRNAKTVEEAYKAVQTIANAGGVILKPFHDSDREKEEVSE